MTDIQHPRGPGSGVEEQNSKADIAALIAEAQSLCDAATPGPWRSDEQVVGWMNGRAPGCAVRYESASGPNWATWDPVAMCQEQGGGFGMAGTRRPVEDAAFIARARTLIPELIAALREAAR